RLVELAGIDGAPCRVDEDGTEILVQLGVIRESREALPGEANRVLVAPVAAGCRARAHEGDLEVAGQGRVVREAPEPFVGEPDGLVELVRLDGLPRGSDEDGEQISADFFVARKAFQGRIGE